MKIKVKALKPHMRRDVGDEYELPAREAKVLEGLGYVSLPSAKAGAADENDEKEAPKKRTYKRRDMTAE